ncbi:MAG: KilA-N domain-containing protein, partial [Clostridia bacterium]|nr:KilA-N domain-containing protein [Clostridia bacterium]
RSEAGLNRFVMTPTKWIEQTNAIGIVSKAGRYGGGTYAHSDIAMAFATWISPEFQLYMKNNNPSKKGNVRDDANLNQLLVLANMESYNAILIEQGKSQSERLILLRNLAIKQMDTLSSINLSAVSTLPGGDM